MRYLARARVLRVQGSHESSLFTIVVELEVNGALGEDGAFELVEVAGDLRVVTGFDETIF